MCCRFVEDVAKFNEWGNEEDYEVDEPGTTPATRGSKRSAQELEDTSIEVWFVSKEAEARTCATLRRSVRARLAETCKSLADDAPSFPATVIVPKPTVPVVGPQPTAPPLPTVLPVSPPAAAPAPRPVPTIAQVTSAPPPERPKPVSTLSQLIHAKISVPVSTTGSADVSGTTPAVADGGAPQVQSAVMSSAPIIPPGLGALPPGPASSVPGPPGRRQHPLVIPAYVRSTTVFNTHTRAQVCRMVQHEQDPCNRETRSARIFQWSGAVKDARCLRSVSQLHDRYLQISSQ